MGLISMIKNLIKRKLKRNFDRVTVEEVIEATRDMLELNEQLEIACRGGIVADVKLLLERGADIHTGEDMPFYIACERGNIEVVKFLINKGIDIHTYNEQALAGAAIYGNVNIISLLLEAGADIHARGGEILKDIKEIKCQNLVNIISGVEEKEIYGLLLSEVNCDKDIDDLKRIVGGNYES